MAEGAEEREPSPPRKELRRVVVFPPGSFNRAAHFYPRVLNAQIHPLVRSFLSLGNERIAKRYVHLHPEASPDAVSRALGYSARFFQWGGADLFSVTTERGQKKFVIVETNSCPSGQKSMPQEHEDTEHTGYRMLLEKAFWPPVKAGCANGLPLPEGKLAVLYDKNIMEASGYAATLAEIANEEVYLVPCFADEAKPFVRFTGDGVLEILVSGAVEKAAPDEVSNGTNKTGPPKRGGPTSPRVSVMQEVSSRLQQLPRDPSSVARDLSPSLVLNGGPGGANGGPSGRLEHANGSEEVVGVAVARSCSGEEVVAVVEDAATVPVSNGRTHSASEGDSAFAAAAASAAAAATAALMEGSTSANGGVEWEKGEEVWQPVRAALRYVTQRPWTRLPPVTRTFIFNPVLACLAGGRNKAVGAKAYDLHNAQLASTGLSILTPETIWDVAKPEIPLWVGRMGGLAVVKVPYANAGQGVWTITNDSELQEFMEVEQRYDRFIVQALIGNSSWSSLSTSGRLYHVGTIPTTRGNIFASDLRVMVGSADNGFFPVAIYARRARLPMSEKLNTGISSWDMLGTNLSYKNEDGSWGTETERLLLMDSRDFNRLGVGVDDLIEAYMQTVLAVTAIDRLCCKLVTPKGKFGLKLFQSLNPDPKLLGELYSPVLNPPMPPPYPPLSVVLTRGKPEVEAVAENEENKGGENEEHLADQLQLEMRVVGPAVKRGRF